jgi:hypothetical protein
MSCSQTSTHRIDSQAKRLETFLRWITSDIHEDDMPGAGRTFRRRAEAFWALWPVAIPTGEASHVVHVDGIYLARDCVMLIACDKHHVLDWYMARSENSAAWSALMRRMPAPDVVVTDGGTGFEKARRIAWPKSRVQRCVFHVFCQVRRYTTRRPNLPAGAELYALARDLLHIKDTEHAAKWLADISEWNTKWDAFLKETTITDGRRVLTHDRLVKAKNSLNALIRARTLFTYLDPALNEAGPVPATNNRIEGGINAQLRHVLRTHRGLSLSRRAKAVSWWCYLHSEQPQDMAHILKTMPTDDDIAGLYKAAYAAGTRDDGAPGWGDVIAWSELHMPGPFRMDYD